MGIGTKTVGSGTLWEGETHTRCWLYCSVCHSRVCTPARHSSTGNPSQINMIGTPSLTLSPVVCVIADSRDLSSIWFSFSCFHFFAIAKAFLFLAYIMPTSFVACSCFFWLSYLRPWLTSSCQPIIYFLISQSYLQLCLSMVTCPHFLYDLPPNKAWTAAFCYCFINRFDGYQICLIGRLLPALLSSLLVMKFLCTAVVLLGCSIMWSRLSVLLPIFSMLMGKWIIVFQHSRAELSSHVMWCPPLGVQVDNDSNNELK